MKLLENTDQLLATILVCNNLSNVVCATVATILVVNVLGAGGMAVFSATLIVTIMILVCSEITPKALGVRYAETISITVALPLSWLVRLLTPFVKALHIAVRFIMRLIGFQGLGKSGYLLRIEELKTIVRDREIIKDMEGSQREMILNLIDFKDAVVEDIMIPKNDIDSINMEESPEILLEQLFESPFSYLPAHTGKLEETSGFLSMRVVLAQLQQGENLTKDLLTQSLLPALFVPAQASIVNQVTMFNHEQTNIALVVDEYGEVTGLITLSDIATEILGDIADPSRIDWHSSLQRDDRGNIIADGRSQIRQLNQKFNIDLPLSKSKTLNGLILEYLREIPDVPLCVEINEIQFELMRTQSNSVRMVKVMIPAKTQKQRTSAPQTKDQHEEKDFAAKSASND